MVLDFAHRLLGEMIWQPETNLFATVTPSCPMVSPAYKDCSEGIYVGGMLV